MLKKIILFPMLICLFATDLAFSADPQLDGLRKILPGIKIGSPQETPIKGLYVVRIGGKYAYITADGEYALIGQLLDIKQGINLTEKVQASENVPLIESFPQKDMIIFPAKGKERSFITVFSDTTCPYCKKLHKEVPALQDAGITVRYIPYPRSLKRGGGFKVMLSVWCSDDRVKTMNIANGVVKGKILKNECAMDDVLIAGYKLGNQLGVRGTPSIFLADGVKLGGYVPAKKILRRIFPTLKDK